MPVLLVMLRAIAIILGIVLAAIGGVIAYRAYFLEPSTAVIISERGVRIAQHLSHYRRPVASGCWCGDGIFCSAPDQI